MWSLIPSSLFRLTWRLAVGFLAVGFLLATGFFTGTVNATVILSGCGGAASDFGTNCSLAELDPFPPQPSGSITINDKIFENWGANRTSSSFGNNIEFRAGIRVDPIDDPLNPGLRFVDTNGVWDHGDEFSFDDIDFDVRVLSGAARIKDVELIMEVGRIAAGTPPDGIDGFVRIEYLVTDGFVDSVEVRCEFVSCANTTISNALNFTPQSLIELSGLVDIIAGQAPGAGEGAQLLSYTVLISQVEVPGPSTLLLLALGVLGAGIRRRR